jgi:protease-4
MKKFVISFFAVIGFVITVLLVSLVTFAVKQKERATYNFPESMILTLRIADSLYEAPEPASLFNPFKQTPLTVPQIVHALDNAAQDTRIKALKLNLKGGQYGLAQLQEVRDAVIRFRAAGKTALVFADTLGDGPAMGSYYLATAFDQIWMQPIGELGITGLHAETPFGRDLLKKIGVQPQILHQGRYKSYPESLMRNSMSDDNREMMTSLLGDIYSQFTHAIVTERRLSPDTVKQAIDQAPLSADQAIIIGLIDAIGYNDEMDAYLEQTTNGASTVSLEDYAFYSTSRQKAPKTTFAAYITIEGTLMDIDAEDGFLGSGMASADGAAKAISEAADHERISAILIRVNSPGGSPVAAEIIRRAIVNAMVRKPVIISMGDSAASGGYWLSAPASAIVAQPATLTGSIGVFGGKIALDNLWKKLGVNWQAISHGQQAGMWSVNTPYNADEKKAIQASLERIYADFITRVSQGRKLSPEQVEKIAQGRVWTGQQALQVGLVDALGGVDKAVTVLREKAQINDSQKLELVPFPEQPSPMAQLLKFAQRGLGRNAQITSARVESLNLLSDMTQIPSGDLAALLSPNSITTYSFVRVY